MKFAKTSHFPHYALSKLETPSLTASPEQIQAAYAGACRFLQAHVKDLAEAMLGDNNDQH